MGASNFNVGLEAGTSVIGGSLGAASAIGGVEAGTMGALAGVSAATAGIGAAVAGLILLIEKFFHGCGSPCIEASQIEQIFEASADNLLTAEKAGWITSQEAVAAMNTLIQQGASLYAQYPQLQQHGQAGLRNMTNVIQAEIQDAQAIAGGTSPLPSNFASSFIQPGTQGWYANSLQQALQLSSQMVQQIVSSRSALSSVPLVGQAASALTQGVASLPVVGTALQTASKVTGISSGNLALLGLALIAWKLL